MSCNRGTAYVSTLLVHTLTGTTLLDQIVNSEHKTVLNRCDFLYLAYTQLISLDESISSMLRLSLTL